LKSGITPLGYLVVAALIAATRRPRPATARPDPG
jgi:hypothetical protein